MVDDGGDYSGCIDVVGLVGGDDGGGGGSGGGGWWWWR